MVYVKKTSDFWACYRWAWSCLLSSHCTVSRLVEDKSTYPTWLAAAIPAPPACSPWEYPLTHSVPFSLTLFVRNAVDSFTQQGLLTLFCTISKGQMWWAIQEISYHQALQDLSKCLAIWWIWSIFDAFSLLNTLLIHTESCQNYHLIGLPFL